jgi:DNA-binding beta-propeller fold protein YncE
MTDPIDLLPIMLAEVPDPDDDTLNRLSEGVRTLITGTSAPRPRRWWRKHSNELGASDRRVRTREVVVLVLVALFTALTVTVAVSSGRATKVVPASRTDSALIIGLRTLDRDQQTVLIPLDPVTSQIGAPIVVPAQGGVAIAPGGRLALLLDPVSDLLYPVDLPDGQVGRPIHVGSRPASVAFSPDGTTAYVADAGSDGCALPGPNCTTKSDVVTPVNLRTDRTEHPIRICPGPMQVAMDPSGLTLWVACFLGGVDEVSTSTDRVVAHFAVPGSPGNIAFADGGRTVIVGQIVVQDLQVIRSYVVLVDAATGRVGKPINVGLPGGTSIAAVTPSGVAYISTWGHTGPGGQVTTEIVPLDLRSGRLGSAVAVRGSGEPVAYAGYWPGVGVRYVTYASPSGDLWEGAPNSSTSSVISTGIRDTYKGVQNAFMVAIDPNAPYVIVGASSSGGGVTSIKMINLATRGVGATIAPPGAVRLFGASVVFPTNLTPGEPEPS